MLLDHANINDVRLVSGTGKVVPLDDQPGVYIAAIYTGRDVYT